MKSRRVIALIVALTIVILLAIGANNVWEQFTYYSEIQDPIETAVHDFRFDFLDYEIGAIAGKIGDVVRRPGSRLTIQEQVELIERYQQRANDIARFEYFINQVYADPAVADPDIASAELREDLAALKNIQESQRSLVEAVLERQVQGQLDALGLTKLGVVLPPVRFSFSELPNNLIVSPRERIVVEAGVPLISDLDLAEIEAIESEVAEEFDRSTLIEGLGGLGVWPAIVSDSSSLGWILSTIAHEWVHNYLVFHPLGWNMFSSADMNTISETVASIVGDEVGELLAYELYAIPLPPPPTPPGEESLEDEYIDPDIFDFRREMHSTRLKVDDLLAAGEVEEAEQYMEERRQAFVEEGYNIRKLNQAYFAFHGSYATGAASSDPIGPKLVELRALTPDLATFMHVVQGIGDPAELDQILDTWRSGNAVPAAELP